MKFLITPGFVLLSAFIGCGSGSEVTVYPAPNVTPEQIEKSDAESDRARQQAILKGS